MKAQRNFNLNQKKLHFIGIGGIGMSALARFFYKKGLMISGSDKEESNNFINLLKEGIQKIWYPHSREKVAQINPDCVIYSTAIVKDNEEIIWAQENKKEILHRSELLEHATHSKKVISISGTHGKTTTSAMITEMLINNGLDPSALLGGILESANTNTLIGSGDYFVVEGDESDKSFLKGDPNIAIITNIEADHLENYPGGINEIKNAFLEFAKKSIIKEGLIACMDDANTKEIILKNFNLNDPKLITYGINSKNTPYTLRATFNQTLKSWDIYLKEVFKTSLKLKCPGRFNLLNALAAFCAGHLIGINPQGIKQALENYQGVKRRFQFIVQSKEITIIDDYAHHPTEILATINAAKELNARRLVIVLQPHQPTRLRDLWKEFKEVLSNEEAQVFLTDTYIARGKAIEGITSQKLVEEVNKPNINYIGGSIHQIQQFLENYIKPGDLILIMGAGDITTLGPALLKSYKTLAMKFGNK